MAIAKPSIPEISGINSGLLSHFSDPKISMSLKYYQNSCECLSDWEKKDLKSLSGLIKKLAERTGNQVRSVTQTCHAHKGNPKKEKFKRPHEIDKGLTFYSLDVGKKSRVHGFFIDPIFFIVWLDSKHQCFG